jgi:hypothetical protein
LAILFVLSACNHELFDVDINTTSKTVVYINIESAYIAGSGRSILPSFLDLNLRYELWGSISGGEIKLKDFTALSNNEVELTLGTWSFTLKAYKDTALVFENKKQGVAISQDTSSISFDVHSAAEDGKGSLHVSLELPADCAVTSAELTIDGAEGIPIAVVNNKIEYHRELREGEYFVMFSLKNITGTTIAVISELTLIRAGWVSEKTITVSAEDLNHEPQGPSNLKASEWQDSTLTFIWTDNSNNETGFLLNDGIQDYEIPAGRTSHDIPLVTPPESPIIYSLRAVNAYGESAAVSCSIVVPGKPQGVNATVQSSEEVMVSWQEVTGVSGYQVYRSKTLEGVYTKIKEGITTTSYADIGIAPLTGYYYKISAVNIFGESKHSDSVHVTTVEVFKPAIGIFYGNEEKVQNGLIDMGDLGIHIPADIEITIKNFGNTILTIMPDDITITGTNSEVFLLKNKPASLVPAGDESKCILQCTLPETGEYNAIITVPNDDTSRNPAVFFIKAVGVVVYADMEVSRNDTKIENHTGIFDFGSVEIGDSLTQTFGLKNTGKINLKLDGNPIIDSSDTALFSIVTVPSKKELLPNETVQFTVRYTPQTEGLKSAEITIPCNIQAGTFKFKTQGTGYAKKPEIAVKQADTVLSNEGVFNFGSITTIEQKAVTFTITNTGDAHLTLSNNPAVYVKDSDAFSITQQPSASIAPNETTSFTVRFSPATAADTITATVIIKSNSKENEEFSLQVKGSSYQVIPVNPSIVSVTGDIHTTTQNVGMGLKTTTYPITISWTASPGAEKYKIYYATTATGFTSRNYTTVTDATSATILGRSTTQYKYIKISAVNGAGESEPTEVKTITKWTTSSASYGGGT